MSLAKALAAATEAGRLTGPPPNLCHTCWLLDTLEQSEADALRTLLASTMSANEIADLLADEGYDVRFQSVRRHRGGRGRTCR
jgi:hypothetical protein